MKILLVEDHAFLRESIAHVLSAMDADVSVVQATDGVEALALLRQEKKFSLVMLDLALPGVDGMGCLQTIRKTHPKLPVLVVSAYDDLATIQRVRAGGANGFLPKKLDGATWQEAVRAVMADGEYWPASLTQKQDVLSRQPETQAAKGKGISGIAYGLTKRQMVVLQLLVAGRSNREIAQQLELTEGTVKVHLNNIFKVLGVNSRAQAIVTINKFGINLEE